MTLPVAFPECNLWLPKANGFGAVLAWQIRACPFLGPTGRQYPINAKPSVLSGRRALDLHVPGVPRKLRPGCYPRERSARRYPHPLPLSHVREREVAIGQPLSRPRERGVIVGRSLA